MNSIDQGVTGRKGSIAIPTKVAEKIAGEPARRGRPITAWLRSLGPLLPFAVPIADAQKFSAVKPARRCMTRSVGGYSWQ